MAVNIFPKLLAGAMLKLVSKN